jgi:putative MATE family efflux protein
MLEAQSIKTTTPGFWTSIKEALVGSHQDYTQGSIERAILLLSVPMVLEMCMESLFGVVDVFWVAHLGADAMATVGLTESALTIVYSLAMGLSISVTAMVARRVGEKDAAGAATAAVQGIAMGVLVSIVTGTLGFVFGGHWLATMGAADAVVASGSSYTRIMLAGTVTVFQLFLINAVFRGAGDAATAMRTLWIANAVNLCLNPCLIFGLGPFPRLGLAGSAVGTTIGRGIGVVYQIWLLWSGRGRVRIGRSNLHLDWKVMVRLIRLSLGVIFQLMVQMAGWIGIVRIVSAFGSAAVAANTLAIRIVVFAILPSWGMSNAAATLVGQNLGAGKPDRAEKSVWKAGLYNMLFLGTVGVVFIVFAEPILGLFTRDPAVLPIAVTCLRYLSYGYVSYAYGMVVSSAFNGAGDTLTPTVLNLICFWAVQIPLAYLLAFPLGLGLKGVFATVVVADSLLAVLAIVWFRRGRWKQQVV